MKIIGLMSGTSMDGIDAAAADFRLDGDTLVLRTLGNREMPWPESTRNRLRRALPPAAMSAGELCALQILVGDAFAVAARAMVDQVGGADLIASHGQTVFHWVENGRARGSLQLGQPAVIAEATGLPVIADFRARDIAAGGQGAPLASTFDALWLGQDKIRAALNLGGIANITIAGPNRAALAYDTGPASCLLDVEALRLSSGTMAFDRNGQMALAGRVRPDLLNRLLADPYYTREAPKSTGREYYHTRYVAEQVAGLPPVSGPDLMATLTELTAVTVADAVRLHGADEVWASGGGVRNPALMAAIKRKLDPVQVVLSAEKGLPEQAKEAYLFALLGFLSWNGLPGTVSGATGATGPRILGSITPGAQPLTLPKPGSWPVRLRIEAGA